MPKTPSVRALSAAAHECRGCDLYKTATQVVFGARFKLMQNRGKVVTSPLAEQVVATIHASSVLRAPDSEGRRAAYAMLVEDLKVVAKLLRKH